MVESVSKFAGTVSQTTGGKYCSFSDLNNIRNSTSGSWAVSSVLIQGKSETPNRPSTISGTNFGFNLPQGAEPTKVIVTYRHQKVAGSDWTSSNKHIMNIPAPTISLRGTGSNSFSGKGVAPTKADMVTSTKTFNVSGKLTRTQVNSSSFGFKLDYPTNSNSYNGYMRVSYVKITVEYKKSQYGYYVKKVSGGYNEEEYTIELSISNKNLTSFNPSLTLTSPVGFSFVRSSDTGTITHGTITQASARSFTWNPELSSKVGTSSINLVFMPNVTYPSGQSSYTGTFTLSESLYGTSKDLGVTITERPPTPSEESEGGSVIDDGDTASVTEEIVIEVIQGNEFILDFDALPATQTPVHLYFYGIGLEDITYGGQYSVKDDQSGIYGKACYYAFEEWTDEGHVIYPITGNWTITKPVKIKVLVNSRWYFYINVLPNEEYLSTPFLTLLQLTEEELDRLGTGYPYIVQSFMKHSTTDTNTRDWYKNNRIGVFNNAIEANITVEEVEIDGEIVDVITDTTDYTNLTDEEIFTNAEYWSTETGGLNEYNNIECEFTYNSDYPLYIICTGDYPEAEDYGYDIGTVSYTEPCIIEKTSYNGNEANGNYPTPIQNLISDDGTSEANIPTLNNTKPVILYDYPLDDGYGTNDEMSVRGIEVTGDIEQSDELVITGKLKSPTGEVGERTTVINNKDYTIDNDTTFQLGGLGDNWGFQTTNITNLEDWELELTINNILLEDYANINFGNIQIIIYIEKLDKQEINIKIEDEDLSYYGAVIKDVKLQEGLETDTSFLDIDGTDTNEPYRQNIREKEIEIELSIGGCDVITSTDMLQQLTQLLVNDKDSLNRPILKRIEFSHRPGEYYLYLLEKAIEADLEITHYNVKVKLTIPAGTSYSKESIVTNITGNVQGLAAVSPMISFKPQSSVIEINELVSGQRFSMGYGGDWQSKIVELDCANRIAYLKTNEDDTQPVDISKYVDFNSDWFRLHGEYSFSGTNCVIRRVEYQERR